MGVLLWKIYLLPPVIMATWVASAAAPSIVVSISVSAKEVLGTCSDGNSSLQNHQWTTRDPFLILQDPIKVNIMDTV